MSVLMSLRELIRLREAGSEVRVRCREEKTLCIHLLPNSELLHTNGVTILVLEFIIEVSICIYMNRSIDHEYVKLKLTQFTIGMLQLYSRS